MAQNLVNIDHLANLARLDFSDEEKATIAPQLWIILEYVWKLSQVDTTNVSNRTYVTDAVNVWREDIIESCDPEIVARCLEAFPKKVGTALSVPGIFEERTL